MIAAYGLGVTWLNTTFYGLSTCFA